MTDATPDVPEAADRERDEAGRTGSERPAASSPVDAPPSKDAIFGILENERRRHVLEFLRTTPSTTLSDLAEHVASVENDKPVRDLTSNERKRVYVSLYQSHLQKMADAGVIAYDRSRGAVELRAPASYCFVYLDIDPTADVPDGGTVGTDDETDSRRLRDRLASVLSSVGRD